MPLKSTPWPKELKEDLIRLRYGMEKPYSGEDVDRWLDSMTYKQFLVDHLALNPAVTEYVDPILAVSAFGLGSDVISAYAAYTLAMPGVNAFSGGNRYEDYDILSFPGGNSAILRYFIRKTMKRFYFSIYDSLV